MASARHAKCLAFVKNRVKEAIDSVQFTDPNAVILGTAQYCLSTAFQILEALTETALFEHRNNTRSYVFHANKESLTQEYIARLTARRRSGSKARQPRKYICGMFDSDRVLHLSADNPAHMTLPQTYAHEISHSIDGAKHRYSAHRLWEEAWENELEHFEFGVKSPTEGFAEFGSRLYSGAHAETGLGIDNPNKDMPQCVEVWKGWQLWPLADD